MGTNLSQVFISNTDVLQAPVGGGGTDLFTAVDNTPEVGIWNPRGAVDAKWVNSKLFETQFVTADTDTDTADGSDPSSTITSPTPFANPIWLYKELQFVQGTSNNPIASPLIDVRNIRSITYTPYTAFAGTKATIADATLNVANAENDDQYNFKFIIRSTPTDHLNFYDPAGLNIFGDFPLGAFNTTNHKAINMTVVIPDVDDADGTGNLAAIQDALALHPILGKMFTANDDTTPDTNLAIIAKHPGVIFDLLIENVTQDADPVSCEITGQVLGSGNDWQVIGEEIRCRSRYGNFNRMYLPQHMEAFGKKDFKYDKIVIEYEHNWPTSTGIAPAGALNQIVIYNTDAGGSAPVVGDTENKFDDAFGYTIANGNTGQYVW